MMSNAEFHLDKDTLINLEQSMQYEWLITNGCGAYASGTASDCNTRKYHGLFVSPLEGKEGRYALLSKMEATITIQGNTFHLSTNDYPGAYHPTGHKYLREFHYENFPRAIYRIGDIVLEKTVYMEEGESSVIISYKVLEAEKSFTLTCHPMMAYRHFHTLSKENMDLQIKTFDIKGRWKIEPYSGLPPFYFDASTGCKYFPAPDWFFRLNYLQEKERGQDYEEDLFCPGFFEKRLKQGDKMVIRAGLEEPLKNLPTVLKKLETETIPDKKTNLDLLKDKGESFIVRNDKGNAISIIAGFPWFGEWGRDTMISLAGLTVYRDRIDDAVSILKHYVSFINSGLLPNQLGIEKANATYNSIDASLWFFKAMSDTYSKCDDKEQFKKDFLPAMESIFSAYVNGKVPYTALLKNGFISVGNAMTQLTWMDARSDGIPVTPRYGCAVELNALWYHALSFYNKTLGCEFEGELSPLKSHLQSVEQNFEELFWCEDCGHLFDTVGMESKDGSMRPNQLFALSLTDKLISADKARLALQNIERELLTPLGMRTLSPKNNAFKGYYVGPENERAKAYHQGTVWPWLIGAFVEANLRYNHKDKEVKSKMKEILHNLCEQTKHTHGLGFISEIYDGASPHQPKGCPAQAWSTAEVIRASALLKEGVV
jgi:predicted glycogen debranching enzyme